MRQAQIFSNGILAGMLTETDSGNYIFRYEESLISRRFRKFSLRY